MTFVTFLLSTVRATALRADLFRASAEFLKSFTSASEVKLFFIRRISE